MDQKNPEKMTTLPATFARRLGALFYDTLLMIAVVLCAAVPFVLIAGDTSRNFLLRLLFQFYLLAAMFFYYAGFWTRGGQTLGLRTWKLKLIVDNGKSLTWRIALKRFAAAGLSLFCLGVGFLWSLIDKEKLTWHDRLSGTRLIRIEQTNNP